MAVARKKHSARAAPLSDYVTTFNISKPDLRLIERLTTRQPSSTGKGVRKTFVYRTGKAGATRGSTSKTAGSRSAKK